MHEKWAEAQTQALIALGIDALEAERSVAWILVHLPPGAEPQNYVFSASELEEPLDDKAIMDARIAWYAANSVPGVYKRLLDAR